MIDTSKLKTCTCRVRTDTNNGTGIFIGVDLILTSRHIIENFLTEEFEVINYLGEEIPVIVLDHCTMNDLALLKTKGSYQSKSFAELCNEEPLIGTAWAVHGHPITSEGQSVGTKLYGLIADVITIDHEHDVVLNPSNATITRECRGFSGSGVINHKSQVTSILRYRDTNDICSVSIKKAEDFLRKNGVFIKEDELYDFSTYANDTFQTIANPFKDICTAHAGVVAKKTAPQTIADGLMGNLFYPAGTQTLKEVIGYLKKNSNLNNSLWVGWLEFLTYIQMLKGNYSNIHAIYITIHNADVSRLVEGTETTVNQNISLTLQFFLTEEKEYFSLARRYLLDKTCNGALENYHCHIFHSPLPKFGFQPFTKEDKRKIVLDIFSPEDAGLTIAGDVDLGVLSFNELSMKVAKSRTLAEATQNLIQIFTDAIS